MCTCVFTWLARVFYPCKERWLRKAHRDNQCPRRSLIMKKYERWWKRRLSSNDSLYTGWEGRARPSLRGCFIISAKSGQSEFMAPDEGFHLFRPHTHTRREREVRHKCLTFLFPFTLCDKETLRLFTLSSPSSIRLSAAAGLSCLHKETAWKRSVSQGKVHSAQNCLLPVLSLPGG